MSNRATKQATVTARGQLRHLFHGTYRAVIALSFPDAQSAARALPMLGEPWKGHPTSAVSLVWAGDSQALTRCKVSLVYFGANEKKIDSLRKSVDYGEIFECSFPV